MYRNAILSMVFFAETSRTNNIITKLYFPLISRMQCSILNVISIVLSLVCSGLKAFLSAILKGQKFNMSGEGLLEILRQKKPSDLEGRKNDRFCLCYHHKQKFCLIYTQQGGETKSLSRNNLSSSPQRLNGSMNVVCYETNGQSETRTNDG